MISLPNELQAMIYSALGYSDFMKLKFQTSKSYYKYFFSNYTVSEYVLFEDSLLSSMDPYALLLEFFKNKIDKFKHNRSEWFNPKITGDNYYEDLLINKDNDVHSKLVKYVTTINLTSDDSFFSQKEVQILGFEIYISQRMINTVVKGMQQSAYFLHMTNYISLIRNPYSSVYDIFVNTSTRELQEIVKKSLEFLRYCLRETILTIYDVVTSLENLGKSQIRYLTNHNMYKDSEFNLHNYFSFTHQQQCGCLTCS
jgi:hypothetical protein